MENWSQSIQQTIDIIDRCIRQQEDEALTLRALSAALGVLRIVCVAEVSGAVRHVPARLSALPASGVCPAGRPRHIGFPAGNCRALRLFLARGVHPRIPRRLRRDPQRVPPAPDCRRPPHHLEAFRLLSAWHRRNGHGRID